jgi:hypothetical protein
MADNNFKGGPGGRLKAAAANLNKPTTQDSLTLYNNAIALDNFYKKSKSLYKHQDYTTTPYGKTVLKNPFLELDNTNLDYKEKIKAYPAQDVIKNNNFETIRGENKIPAYRKEIDKNKFYQRELSHGNINIDAPMALYDRRIKPTIFSFYKDDSPFINDDVEIFKYDPLAVKPVSMLTPKERIEREKKYGKIPSSIPKPQPKPIPVIKRTVSEEVEPMASRQAPVPSIMPSEIVAPVMRPVAVPIASPMEEPMMEEEVTTERPVARKPPRAVMPRRQGGWGNQSIFMRAFPNLFAK